MRDSTFPSLSCLFSEDFVNVHNYTNVSGYMEKESIALYENKEKLDRGLIRSSPRSGLIDPYKLTKEQFWTVPP